MISMVPSEKLCNTIPGIRKIPFHAVLAIEWLVKAIWGLLCTWKYDFWLKF